MKTKILSICTVAVVFSGCTQLTLPQPQAMGINHELIKDIKTDGQGGYYVTKNEDCDKLMQAGVIKKIKRRDGVSSNFYYNECTGVVHHNVINDATGLDLNVFKMPKNF